MAKVLKCADLMPGCDAVIYGKDIDEVMGKAEEHARRDHNMTMIPPSVIQDIESHITDGMEPPRSRSMFGWLRRG